MLVLHSFGGNVAPFSAVVSTFRTTLARELGERVDFYEIPLDSARFAEVGSDTSLAKFLEERFTAWPIDLIFTVGAPAARFAVQNEGKLFTGTPLLIGGADPRLVPLESLRTNTAIVTQLANLPGIISDILQLKPDTTNVVVVLGTSPLEQFWAAECRREWQGFTNQMGFTWVDSLSLHQIEDRVSHLPLRSFVVFLFMIMDAERVPYDQNEPLNLIRAAANAPVFSYFKSQFGLGTVGGRLFQDTAIGASAAQTAIRILRGEQPRNIPPQILESGPPVYDWRELTRWGIRPNRLPPGSIVEFKKPTIWEEYRWHIMASLGFCSLQTALIIGLVFNRARRREEEAAAVLVADLSSRFINLAAGKVDREIEAAQRKVCEALGLDLAALWQWTEDSPPQLELTHMYHQVTNDSRLQEWTNAGQTFPWSVARLQAGEVLLIQSIDDLPSEAASDQSVWRRYGIKSSATFPLSAGGGQLLGVLSFCATGSERSWRRMVTTRLQLVTQIFANALLRKRSEQDLRGFNARLISTQEEERARLARELHDDITQRLARLAIDVGRCETGTSGVSAAETARSVREDLIRLSEDVHALSYRLHPSILEDLGLEPALEAEAERYQGQARTVIEVKVEKIEDPIAPNAALCLFRVAQEGLRNAIRHSEASRLKLSLRRLEGGLQLAVEDDGRGFDPALQRSRPSLGLASMRERVHLVGGEFEVESAPGQGTLVLAWVPLNHPTNQGDNGALSQNRLKPELQTQDRLKPGLQTGGQPD